MRASGSIFIVLLTLAGAGALVAQGGRGQGGRGGAPRVEIKDGEECPPGMVEVRANSCQAPVTAPPSIVDYRPRSTVVAKTTLVPKAKFPVVDVHTHGTSNAANFAQRIPEMDALGLQVLVDLSGGSDPKTIKTKVDAIRASKYQDRFRVFANELGRGRWSGLAGKGAHQSP